MLEKRPIVNITIGYILGIIMGLYCKISIVFLYGIIFFIYSIKKISINSNKINKFKLISFKRYFRYVKIIFTRKVVLIIIISSIISNSIILYEDKKYYDFYSEYENNNISIVGTVISNPIKKENITKYIIKINEIDKDRKV